MPETERQSRPYEREGSHERARKLGRFVERPRLEEYAEKLKEHFVLTRRDGILEARMHTNGGPLSYGGHIHNAIPQLFIDAGNDLDNEVMIFTGTGDYWIAANDPVSFDQPLSSRPLSSIYDYLYWDATKLQELAVFALNFPTISVINGPGFHTEFALLMDMTLCAEDTVFFDPHFESDLVPGDGQHLTFQHLLGTKRAAYHLYTSKPITAEMALDYGLVNEVLPREKLLDRAWEIAEEIRARPRFARRMTAEVVRRPLKKLLPDDLQFGLAHELFAMMCDQPSHEGLNTAGDSRTRFGDEE